MGRTLLVGYSMSPVGLWSSPFLCWLEKTPKNGSMGAAFHASTHRSPHVYLARRVSTKVLGEVACLGSKTLRPELFGEVTIVRACLRVRARVLGFCGPVEAQAPYSPPTRVVRMGKNERTRVNSNEKVELTIKLLHSCTVAQSFTRKRNGSLHLDLPRKVYHVDAWGPHSVAEFLRGRWLRNVERTLRK